ncbi:retinol-binding protein pinta [Euwallacea fornicatus]|uniref:retinol-binding protein pinta n=1 Tax=Euwallacea fornicatus TaxID=995702 RepID=UPI00338D4FDE
MENLRSFNDLDELTKKYAKENLNETDTNRVICLEDLKQWLKDEVPWINARNEDRYLLPFLRGCKFNLEKTKVKMINYYCMKRDRPEWFANRNPLLSNLQELIKLGVFVPLKKYHENKMVVIIRTTAHDPKRHKWDEVFKVGKMILDIACLESEYAQIYGIIALFDMTGMSFSHYRTMTPSIIKNAVFAWQNYHVRPKQLEFINSPTYINIALNIFKSFMTEKMKNRVKVHFGGVSKALNIVSQDILPVEYGGEGDTFEELGNYWFEKLVEYRLWFEEDKVYKADNTM